ncbi:MAG TPA: prepilin peptidase [Candidatus Limnocylindria bacterium]|nr:prepilin peptidase [Candidatus Limnocylindria bacterium]
MSGTLPGTHLEAPRRLWQIQLVVPPILIAVFIFLFGLIIGSFLNVCIVRIPGGKSIVLPSSACPKCGAAIRPYDNIPVISYLLLAGKCRQCKTTISAIYPAVELLTGLMFLACYEAFGLTAETLKWAIFSAIMIVLVFTDLRERVLPDVVNFTGLGLGLALSLFTKPSDGLAAWLSNHMFDFPPPTPVVSLADALFGAAIGSSLLWLVSEAYFRLRGREGMGLGDVKMMLMAGAFLGTKRTLLTIFTGSILGSVLGLIFILARRKDSEYELPFGTFLGMAAVLVVFFGTPVINWYQSLLGVR